MLKKGFLLGPFTPDELPFECFYSPLFCVPKPDFTWRIICHLSFPKLWGISVNDLVDDAWKHVTYIQFVEVCKFVYNLGPGAFLWVVDAKDAYYRVPIKEKYWKYMGINWYGVRYICTSLQMGLASACNIYTRFADAILYIIYKGHEDWFFDEYGRRLAHHYLDDFFGGHPDKETAQKQFERTFDMMEDLGIPTQVEKVTAPCCTIIILGFLYCTLSRTVSVPPKRIAKYKVSCV